MYTYIYIYIYIYVFPLGVTSNQSLGNTAGSYVATVCYS